MLVDPRLAIDHSTNASPSPRIMSIPYPGTSPWRRISSLRAKQGVHHHILHVLYAQVMSIVIPECQKIACAPEIHARRRAGPRLQPPAIFRPEATQNRSPACCPHGNLPAQMILDHFLQGLQTAYLPLQGRPKLPVVPRAEFLVRAYGLAAAAQALAHTLHRSFSPSRNPSGACHESWPRFSASKGRSAL